MRTGCVLGRGSSPCHSDVRRGHQYPSELPSADWPAHRRSLRGRQVLWRSAVGLDSVRCTCPYCLTSRGLRQGRLPQVCGNSQHAQLGGCVRFARHTRRILGAGLFFVVCGETSRQTKRTKSCLTGPSFLTPGEPMGVRAAVRCGSRGLPLADPHDDSLSRLQRIALVRLC